MSQTFGDFIKQLRMEKGFSLREMAAQSGLSLVYMSNIENNRRPAPRKEHLDRLAAVLLLDRETTEQFYDLAALSHENGVSQDLPEYIQKNDIVRAALRVAKEVDATDQEWQEFIERITRRSQSEVKDTQ